MLGSVRRHLAVLDGLNRAEELRVSEAPIIAPAPAAAQPIVAAGMLCLLFDSRDAVHGSDLLKRVSGIAKAHNLALVVSSVLSLDGATSACA